MRREGYSSELASPTPLLVSLSMIVPTDQSEFVVITGSYPIASYRVTSHHIVSFVTVVESPTGQLQVFNTADVAAVAP